nr:MAG TPA: hypothetical protein [Caudoviricetes sp.]
MLFWTGQSADLLRFRGISCRTKFHLPFIDKKKIT